MPRRRTPSGPGLFDAQELDAVDPRAPLAPAEEAVELLKASGMRGAVVGELRPESAREAWLAGHRRGHKDPKDDESRWKVAQGRAETLLRRWQEQRGSGPRRLI